MSPVDDFLNEFCNLEKYLRGLSKASKSTSFSELVRLTVPKNRVVKQYQSDLKVFAELRNLLSHERYANTHLIAPSEKLIASLKEINKKIANQPKLIHFCKSKPLTFTSSQPIQDAIISMRANDFSQVPIMNHGEIIGVLSSNTISRWLGADSSEDIFSTTDTTISHVMTHLENEDNFVLLPKNEDYGKALAKFDRYSSEGKQLDGILLTESGKRNESILGIVTLADIPEIINALY